MDFYLTTSASTFPRIKITWYVGFFCVGVMYSGEYDACDVTLGVYPHRASLKNMPVHGGNLRPLEY